MTTTPSTRESIATIRELIDPTKKKPTGQEKQSLSLAIIRLGQGSQQILGDNELLTDILLLVGEVIAYRGRGNQYAASNISQLLSYMLGELVAELPEFETVFGAFADARKAVPSAASSWDALEKFAMRAESFARGPLARSLHVCALRGEAWYQLGLIAKIVRVPEYLALALDVARKQRAPDSERRAAIEFLPDYWGCDEPDQQTVDLLRALEEKPPSRSCLVGILQIQINFGLNDEFGALFAVDNWDDNNPQE
jgi:hypothetical protein